MSKGAQTLRSVTSSKQIPFQFSGWIWRSWRLCWKLERILDKPEIRTFRTESSGRKNFRYTRIKHQEALFPCHTGPHQVCLACEGAHPEGRWICEWRSCPVRQCPLSLLWLSEGKSFVLNCTHEKNSHKVTWKWQYVRVQETRGTGAWGLSGLARIWPWLTFTSYTRWVGPRRWQLIHTYVNHPQLLPPNTDNHVQESTFQSVVPKTWGGVGRGSGGEC